MTSQPTGRNPFPDYIKSIAVIAPAGPVDQARLERNCKLIEALGINVKIMPHVFSGTTSHYLAADVRSRVEDIHRCWQDSDIQLVLAARGGFGCAHLLPLLDWKLIKQRAMPLLGYSDITAIHLAMVTNGCESAIAAPMAIHFEDVVNDPYTADWLHWSLQPDRPKRHYQAFTRKPLSIHRAGSCEGRLLPVNLAVLSSLTGTPYLPALSDTILLVEDVNEPIYKIDRMLTQLSLGGILARCKAIMFGSFTRCGNRQQRHLLFQQIAESVNVPVVSGFRFGHCLPMTCVPYNVRCSISEGGVIELSG